MDFFQVLVRGCVPVYTSLERANVFEAIFEYVKMCQEKLSHFVCKFFVFYEENKTFNLGIK